MDAPQATAETQPEDPADTARRIELQFLHLQLLLEHKRIRAGNAPNPAAADGVASDGAGRAITLRSGR